jgi:hypothetical protein
MKNKEANKSAYTEKKMALARASLTMVAVNNDIPDFLSDLDCSSSNAIMDDDDESTDDKYNAWKTLDSYGSSRLYINGCHKLLHGSLAAAGVKPEKYLVKNGVDYVVVFPDCVKDYDDGDVDHDNMFPDDDDDEFDSDGDGDGDEDISLGCSGLDDDDDVDIVDVDDDDDEEDDYDGDGDIVELPGRKKGDILKKQEQSQHVLTPAQNSCAMKFQAQQKLAIVLRGKNAKVPHQIYERIIE